ncbi:MAG TPA: RNA polymerase sigma factor [Candidatus Dormibacteraeota bacterium]|nr:RNA polymerase sigma factor [Candidatus Dormibacteraeota bacterium]
MDDIELAERLAIDLDGAFEALVRGHVDRLYAVALRVTGDAADAEEVAQDALVRAYRALERYESARIASLRLRPWLAAIAVNLARNRRRRGWDRVPPLSLEVASGAAHPRAPDADRPEELATRRVERERWAAALACLPERYRVPLVLRHVDDLSYDEMAEALGRPEGTLRAQVHRGLALLRAAWDAAEREEQPA